MKLRAKTLTIITTTLVCLMIMIYILARYVLLDGFRTIEKETAIQDVSRMLDAFSENISNLSIKCTDWAKWDDTYRFISDGNTEFIESNLNDQAVADLRLDYLFLINTKPAIIFCRGFDHSSQSGFEPSDAMKSFLLSDTLVSRHKMTASVTAGIILSPEGPMEVASRPITTSTGKGPTRGAVVFVRKLDEMEVARIGEITHLSLTARPVTALSPDMPETLGSIAVKSFAKDTIAGYGLIKDIHGEPALVGRCTMYRSIVRQGRMTMLYLIAFILVAGLVFGLAVLLLLEKSVISRVMKLSLDVMAISGLFERRNFSRRVTIAGKDEITTLSTAINQLLDTLQRSESAIRERNSQLRLIMDSVPSGLLSLDENLRVNPEYARSVETILGTNKVAGQYFLDLLSLTDEKEALAEFLDLLRNEALPEHEMAGLNPISELQLGDGRNGAKWIRLQYRLISRGDNVPKHLLTLIEDITSEKKLLEKVKNSQRENLQLKAIAEDPDMFRDFLHETRAILNHAEQKLGAIPAQSNQTAIVNEVFRDIHTIKGTASSFGLSAVAEIAGTLENALSTLRETSGIRPDMIEATRKSLALLTKAVLAAVESVKSIMGDDFVDDSDIYLRISLTKLKSETAAINELLSRELIDKTLARSLQQKIEKKLRSFQHTPARKALAKALKIVPELLTRVHKNIRFSFDGAEMPLDCEMARELNTPLVHLIRNAFDHGIEKTSADRIAAGKPAEGHVSLSISADERNITMEIRDDGRGIDTDAVKRVGLAKGLITAAQAEKMTSEEFFSLICYPGFSTNVGLTEISGRGVGLDIVLTAVSEKLHGRVFILSESGKGTTVRIQIPTTLP